MTDRELMQQALKFMDDLGRNHWGDRPGLVAALRERLAHCDRCGKRLGGEGDIHTCTPPAAPVPSLRSTIANDAWAISFQSLGQYRAALLKLIDDTPPAAQWEQLASLIDENQRLRAELKFNTPPAAQWVGLTDEERSEIAAQGHQRWKEHAQAIEAKLKEKNTCNS